MILFNIMPPKKKDQHKKKRIIRTPNKIGGCEVSTLMKKMPKRALTNLDLEKFTKMFNIRNFRGIYMRDTLPKRPWHRETAIVNLDTSEGSGTHWVCYNKNGLFVKYFDSLGNRGPPPELVRYLRDCRISFSCRSYQDPSSYTCGHHCILFLLNHIKT